MADGFVLVEIFSPIIFFGALYLIVRSRLKHKPKEGEGTPRQFTAEEDRGAGLNRDWIVGRTLGDPADQNFSNDD